MEKDKKKVVLGLSGGVDSAASALILKKQGYEVTGYYFDVTGENQKDLEAASSLASDLGIDFIHEDVSEEFSGKIISRFCSEYSKGRTPNPCIICNPLIKFRKLIETADRTGAYYIATGHYADIYFEKESGIYYVRNAANTKKDQSYMLYRLGQDVLSRVIFPLGKIETKEEVREIARKYRLPNADNADSQEICFIDDKVEKYSDFVERKGYRSPEGCFVDESGKKLGKHMGISHYTLGQRKGLGIALGKPAFVTEINLEKNTVVLGSNDELFSRYVISSDNCFVPGLFSSDTDKPVVMGKIRYAAKPSRAVLEKLDGGLVLATFDEPQRAATPGQSVVYYKDGLLAGGGFIESSKQRYTK